MKKRLINEDCFETMKKFPNNCLSAIVTDPPYGLTFMNKDWDKPDNIVFTVEFWKEALRVLKPGAHIIVFSSSRTYHWLAIAIEKAGFEIRDQLMWVYGSGFPKGQNIAKAIDKQKLLNKKGEWDGWNTALKPAHEPIVLARKPIEKGLTIAKNVEKWGVGGINIDDCRIPFKNGDQTSIAGKQHMRGKNVNTSLEAKPSITTQNDKGRYPANFIHSGEQQVLDLFPHTKSGYMGPKHTRHTDGSPNGIYNKFDPNHPLSETYADEGSAARFFYCAKVSQKERNLNMKNLKNNHPTVKPIKLMEYLIKLITPPKGVLLDPFMGSGTTGLAAKNLNKDYFFIGVELNQDYFNIAKERLNEKGGE